MVLVAAGNMACVTIECRNNLGSIVWFNVLKGLARRFNAHNWPASAQTKTANGADIDLGLSAHFSEEAF